MVGVRIDREYVVGSSREHSAVDGDGAGSGENHVDFKKIMLMRFDDADALDRAVQRQMGVKSGDLIYACHPVASFFSIVSETD